MTNPWVGCDVVIGFRAPWYYWLKPWKWRQLWRMRPQRRRIVASEGNTLTVDQPWREPPSAGNVFHG